MTHPDVPAEQAHVDLAYARLAAMRAAAAARLQDAFGERGGHLSGRYRARHPGPQQPQPARAAGDRPGVARLRPHRPRQPARWRRRREGPPGRQRLRRAAARRARPRTFHIGRLAISDERPGAARCRLAGPDRRAFLPGHRRPPHGPGPPAALPYRRPAGVGPRRRAVRRRGRRARRRSRPLRAAGAARHPGAVPHRPHARHRGDRPARAGRDHPRPAAGHPGGPGRPGNRQDRGGPAPGGLPALHPPLPSREPRRAGRRARTPPSCATSSTCCRPSTRAASSCRPSTACSRGPARPAAKTRTPTASRETPAWPGSSPAPSPTASDRCAERSRSPSAPAAAADHARSCRPRWSAAAKRRAGTHNARRRTVEALAVAALLASSSRRRRMLGRRRRRRTPDRRGPRPPAAPPAGDDRRPGTHVADPHPAAAPARPLRRRPRSSSWPRPTSSIPPSGGSCERPRAARSASVRWTDADIALLDEARALLGPPRRRTGTRRRDSRRALRARGRRRSPGPLARCSCAWSPGGRCRAR